MFISFPPPISALRLNLGVATSSTISRTKPQFFSPNIPKPLDSCIFMQLSSRFRLFPYIPYSYHSSRRLRETGRKLRCDLGHLEGYKPPTQSQLMLAFFPSASSFFPSSYYSTDIDARILVCLTPSDCNSSSEAVFQVSM